MSLKMFLLTLIGLLIPFVIILVVSFIIGFVKGTIEGVKEEIQNQKEEAIAARVNNMSDTELAVIDGEIKKAKNKAAQKARVTQLLREMSK